MASTSDAKPAIVVDELHVTYRVYASGKRVDPSAESPGELRRERRGMREVHALKGVSFVVREGETVGVIGHNGSGKSTLFRTISGLQPASSGRVWAEERPVLLGVNAALLGELSGAKNIKLGLLALGFSAKEAEAQVEEIAQWADLSAFIDHPMRTYSSGMGARLKFAIGSAKHHSVLLIDEALATGDKAFKAKSEARIRELHEEAGTVMIVSHSLSSILSMSTRVLWLDHGELRMDGDPKEVVAAYEESARKRAEAASLELRRDAGRM